MGMQFWRSQPKKGCIKRSLNIPNGAKCVLADSFAQGAERIDVPPDNIPVTSIFCGVAENSEFVFVDL